MKMPEGWGSFKQFMHLAAQSFFHSNCIYKSNGIECVEFMGKPIDIDGTMELMKEMAFALDQYRGQAGRDALADREGSRYSIADEVLEKFRNWK